MKWTHHEPLFWGLFGVGGIISAFFVPVIILLLGLAYPLGLLPEGVFSYQNMFELAQNWTGKVAILLVCSFTLWHCAHRIFHGLHDVGYQPGQMARSLTYGTAGFGSAVLLVILLTI